MSDVLHTINACLSRDVEALVDEVNRKGEPFYLTKDGKPYAIIVPLGQHVRERHKTEEDYQRFLSAAGSWKDFDAEAFLAEIRMARDGVLPPSNDQ